LRGTPDAPSRAIEIRHSTKWFSDYAARNLDEDQSRMMRRVFQVVHVLAGLLEKNPEGECRPPLMPIIA
jgi:hypothetical protein